MIAERCHCLCGLHGLDVCTGDAVILVEMEPNPYARVVPMCAPCAQAYTDRKHRS